MVDEIKKLKEVKDMALEKIHKILSGEVKNDDLQMLQTLMNTYTHAEYSIQEINRSVRDKKGSYKTGQTNYTFDPQKK